MNVNEIQILTQFLIDETFDAKEMMDKAGKETSEHDFHEGRQLQALKTIQWVEDNIKPKS